MLSCRISSTGLQTQSSGYRQVFHVSGDHRELSVLILFILNDLYYKFYLEESMPMTDQQLLENISFDPTVVVGKPVISVRESLARKDLAEARKLRSGRSL
jgi:hypothetical protein